uniref:Ig-like domain-containing protein n=1 Tax=Myripristis murdjan TaxID=586833 RepID=A0A668ABF4_9TELE
APLLVQHCVLMALSLALTATAEGLRVRQHPPSLSVMRGETATLSCHFKAESLKYGVQWFKMRSEKRLIPNSSRQSLLEKNQTSSLVISEVALEDSGLYYCEVNVLHRDPERGGGTRLIVLGEKPVTYLFFTYLIPVLSLFNPIFNQFFIIYLIGVHFLLFYCVSTIV